MLPSDVRLPAETELCEGARISLTTKILGCKISAHCSAEFPCIEIAEGIFSSLESLLSTSAIERAVATEPEATVNVEIGDITSDFLSLDIQEHLGRPHFRVQCKATNPYDLAPEEIEKLGNEIFLASLKVFPHLVLFHNMEQDLEDLFKDEKVAERASFVAVTTGAVYNVLGSAPKFRLQDWLNKESSYKMVRSEPWQPNLVPLGDAAPNAKSPMRMRQSEAPSGLVDFTKLSHDDIEIRSHIRLKLWDRAGWSGVVFMWSPDPDVPPVFGLTFKNIEAGTDIFKSWQAEFGDTDEARSLRISIIRGINRENPYAYRVLIGSGEQNEAKSSRLVMVAQRMQQMDTPTPTNLNNFLNAYETNRHFLLAPAFDGMSDPTPLLDNSIGMYELAVRNAWEIGVNDPDALLGVLADDNVIIPEGVVSPPVEKLQEWKRSRHNGD